MNHHCFDHFKDYLSEMSLISLDDSNKDKPIILIKSYKRWIDFDKYTERNNRGKASVDTLFLWHDKGGKAHLIEFKNQPLSNSDPDEIAKKFDDSLQCLQRLPCWEESNAKYKKIFVYSKSKNQNNGFSKNLNFHALEAKLRSHKKRNSKAQIGLKASSIQYIDDQEFRERYADYL